VTATALLQNIAAPLTLKALELLANVQDNKKTHIKRKLALS
jgi:spore maturation protein SpmA